MTVKTKAALNLPTWVREIDACFFHGYQSFSKANKCTKEKVFHKNSHQLPQYCKNTETLDRSQKNCKSNKCNKRECCDCGACGLRLPGSTPVTGLNTTLFLLGITKTATSHHSGKTGTWVKLLVIIIIRKGILLISAPSSTSQKTSIGFNNLHAGDLC